MELALKSELSLQRGDSIDAFMPTETVLNTNKKIDRQIKKEIELVDKADADYAKKVLEIEARGKHTKFKIMK